jgi:hypothetical protein
VVIGSMDDEQSGQGTTAPWVGLTYPLSLNGFRSCWASWQCAQVPRSLSHLTTFWGQLAHGLPPRRLTTPLDSLHALGRLCSSWDEAERAKKTGIRGRVNLSLAPQSL